ncbi:MAG: hypothetical protein U1F43_28730 [Myxococcota bacterium]
MAAAAVERLLASIGAPALGTMLVAEACAELALLGHVAPGEAVVASARPSAARARLEAVLGAPREWRIRPELGAGVRVDTARGQVDATALGLARHAAAAVAEAVQAGAEAAP